MTMRSVSQTLWLLVLAALSINSEAASVTSAPNAKVCTSSYTSIGDIVISESGAATDFGVVGTATTNNVLFLNAAAGISFEPGVGSVSRSGAGNITSASMLFVSASTVAISYHVDNNTPARMDALTISGLRIKAAAVSVSTVPVTIAAGSTAITGIAAGNTAASFQSAIVAQTLTLPAKYTNDANFFLAGTHTLASGVGLSSTAYSGTGVTGSSFSPSTAGAGVFPVTYTVNTFAPSCAFAVTSSIDVNVPPVIDTDGDGATDAVETQLGTSTTVANNFANLAVDSDSDGLSNAMEASLNTNPNLVDTDGDGINDGIEVIQYVTNPTSTDTDGDSIPDNIDAIPGTNNCTLPLDGIYRGINISGSFSSF